MFLGYNTNGFAHHRLEDAIEIIAELGYGGVALTLDVHHLNPNSSIVRDCERVAGLLADRNLDCVLETGSRFLLDPRRKHQPTLVSPEEADRDRRYDFLAQVIELADDVGWRSI